MAGIYIVDVTTNDEWDSKTRSIVVAKSAQAAAEAYEAPGRKVEVGRIGTYEPGDMGAHLAGFDPDPELVIGPAPR